MGINISVFSDMVKALGQFGRGIATLADIPFKEREKYRETVGGTYELLDSAFTLAINRLGDVLHMEDNEAFVREVRNLDNVKEWAELERKVRLCSNLRAAGREIRGMRDRLMSRLTMDDPGAFDRLVYQCLEQGEGELANAISEMFLDLADRGRRSTTSDDDQAKLREAIRLARADLRKERLKLIEEEKNFMAAI